VTQRATESILINATPLRVYEVVTNFSAYLDWVSDLKAITVLEHDSDGRGLEVTYRAAAFGRSTTYTLRYDYSRAPQYVRWHQVEGDLTSELSGQYRFEERDGQTVVTYDLAVGLLVPIPTFVRRRAAQRIMQTALLDLKHRAEN
jgi:ribosome-associated toxin RatA of RatAB toxin-antitoxin module